MASQVEPDKNQLLQHAAGMEARHARAFLEKHFETEESKLGKEIREAVARGLTGDQAITLCARVAALQELDIALRRKIDAGDEAGKKLEPLLAPKRLTAS